MTPQDILSEFDRWLQDQPDTPARRWIMDNPPRTRDVFRAVRNVQVRGRLEQIVLAA